MAEDTPVNAPTEATEQPEHASAADKPIDKESENVATTNEKPTGKSISAQLPR